MSASTNEPGRMQKCIHGANGMTPTNAVDEQIDNALDADCTIIDVYMDEDGCIDKISDNGGAMEGEAGRSDYLTLDGASKKNDNTKRGMHGIGAMYARGALAKEGTETTTSINDDGAFQVSIDMGKLAGSKDTTCWSGDNGPKWEPFDNSDGKYERGVTKEFEGERRPTFPLNDIVSHFQDKYSNELKRNVKIRVRRGDDIYDTQFPFNDPMWKKPTSSEICVRADGSCHFPAWFGGREHLWDVSADKNGHPRAIRTTKSFTEHDVHARVYVTDSFPEFDAENCLKEKQKNGRLSTSGYVKKNLGEQFNCHEIDHDSITMQHGEKCLTYSCGEPTNSSEYLSVMFTATTKLLYNGNQVATQPKAKLRKMAEGDACVAVLGRHTIEFDTQAQNRLNILKENKSRPTITRCLQKALDTCIAGSVARYNSKCKSSLKAYQANAAAVAAAASAAATATVDAAGAAAADNAGDADGAADSSANGTDSEDISDKEEDIPPTKLKPKTESIDSVSSSSPCSSDTEESVAADNIVISDSCSMCVEKDISIAALHSENAALHARIEILEVDRDAALKLILTQCSTESPTEDA